jgi:hypothetical protein
LAGTFNHGCPYMPALFAMRMNLEYTYTGSGCRLVAVPAFKAVRGAIVLSLVGSIPTPSAISRTPDENRIFYLPFANITSMFYHRSVALVLCRNKERPAMKGGLLVL